MAKKKFDKDILIDLSMGFDEYHEGFRVISDEIKFTSRWSYTSRMVFEAPNGKFYETYYDTGATEMQDYDHWDDHDGECQEVHPVEKLVTVYE